MSVPRSDAGRDDDAQDAPAPLMLQIDDRHAGERVDKALAHLIPDVSRSRLQQWIVAGAVLVNGQAVIARHALTFGDVLQITPQPAPDAAAFTAESMSLDVVYEDDAMLVVNKPPKLVVHPAAGHWSGTLLNGLLAYAPTLADVPRAGIVHRLDADTSGLMVVAKTLAAQTSLVRQLQARSVTREYWALVLGVPAKRGLIDAAIGRDPRNPLRFKVSTAESAKPARTHYARINSTHKGTEISWLACRLETGRTHQIRVHLEHVGHPLIGDPLYRRKLPPRGDDETGWRAFDRQALHACRLSLTHPVTDARLTWFQPPAPDLARLMHELGFGPLDVTREVFE
ncbi:MAG TPA: RluA family pseudouridine synthase [Burkholderiaceae bacterium]|jgi:23S rRNA pseudouridine1911/1915/1917 synthase|nr:RluA family pseudouridine synthase [Burkholderiaceae bacterium]